MTARPSPVFRAACMAVSCCLVSARMQAQEPIRPESLSSELRARVSSEIVQGVAAHFAHWSAISDVPFDTLAAQYLRAAGTTPERRAFDMLTLRFMAALRNGHTDFNDRWLWSSDGAPLGFTPRYRDSQWRVTRSGVAGLASGDAITTIDGEAFEAFFQRQRTFIAESSEREARLVFPARGYLFPSAFMLGLADGRTVRVHRGPVVPLGDATEVAASAVQHRWLVPDSVAYLRIASFAHGAAEREALAAVSDLARSPALVLDLRGNGGGSTPWKLRKALARGPSRDFQLERDLARPNVLVRAFTPLVLRLWRVPHYGGRLIVLTDAGCASACEDLVIALKGNDGTTVVGDTTFGSTGQPYMMDFGNGMTARVSARRARMPNGSAFEGVGITPDIHMPSVVGSTEDRAMQCALTIARRRLPVDAMRPAASCAL